MGYDDFDDFDPRKRLRKRVKDIYEIENFIDQLFNDIREEISSYTPEWFLSRHPFYREEREDSGTCVCPLIDIQRDQDSYLVTISLPGVTSKEEVELLADNESITISAKLAKPVYRKDKNNYCDRYYRQIFLENMDENNIKAKFNPGLIQIKIGKKIKRRKITIE